MQSVKLVGILSIAMVAPNVLGAMVKLGMIPVRRQKEFVNASRDRLIRKGLLAYKEGKLRLTSTGERELRNLQLADYKLQKPIRWDRKWRVLIFDIPERRRGLRDKVRRTLGIIGFERLQDSVWVFPYDCEDLISLLKADFHVGKDMLYLIVDSIENDRHLREIFEIK